MSANYISSPFVVLMAHVRSFRSVRNFVIDLRASGSATGIHWQVSQATSLMNIVFEMNNGNQGIFMENGSGGYMGDLVLNGGQFGLAVGNQQYIPSTGYHSWILS